MDLLAITNQYPCAGWDRCGSTNTKSKPLFSSDNFYQSGYAKKKKKTLQICSRLASGNLSRQLNLEEHTEGKKIKIKKI